MSTVTLSVEQLQAMMDATLRKMFAASLSGKVEMMTVAAEDFVRIYNERLHFKNQVDDLQENNTKLALTNRSLSGENEKLKAVIDSMRRED